MSHSSQNAEHIRMLRQWAVVHWFLTAALVHAAALLPLFDSSPRVVTSTPSSWMHLLGRPALRWDAFHFAHIAQHGYVYEYERAFLPGISMVMRGMAHLLRLVGIQSTSAGSIVSLEDVLLGGVLAAVMSGATTTLYRLTLHHIPVPSVALLASLLSLLSSSPATLRLAPYAEPFFTYFSYKGMLYSARSQWIFASSCFAAAALFRSNGVLLSGFIVWGILIEPFFARKKITVGKLLYTTLLVSVILIPFISHQYIAYLDYCQDVAEPSPWCSHIPPAIYGYVQSKYWGSGFLLYWTPQQLPNLLICSPVLVLLLAYCTHYIQRSLIPRLHLFLDPPTLKTNSAVPTQTHKHTTPYSPFLSTSIAPHAIHTLIFTLLLLFAAHTQIILRLAASMPFTYWAAAWLLVEHPRWGKYWVAWSAIWGSISIILWVTFLPPA